MMITSFIPAGGQTPSGDNPFLKEYKTPFGVPPFSEIKPAHFLPAIETGIEEQNKQIVGDHQQQAKPDFENTIAALDYSGSLIRKM